MITGSVLWFLVKAWFWTHVCYVAVMHARAKRGNLTLYWKIMLSPALVYGFVFDWLLVNWIVGSILFREWPKEALFTTRVERHFNESTGRRLRMAMWWAKQLNLFDATHIKRKALQAAAV